jgi:hypothetical protein
MVLLAALSGCVSMDSGAGGGGGGGYMSQAWNPSGPSTGACGAHCGAYQVASVPGVVGPYGQPVALNGPYASMRPDDVTAARMMSTSVPLDVFQQTVAKTMAPGSDIIQAQAFGPGGPGMNPNFMAGNMPGAPAIMPAGMGGPPGYPGAVAAVGAAPGHGAPKSVSSDPPG